MTIVDVVIVVKDGRVQSLYTQDSDDVRVEATVIDVDGSDNKDARILWELLSGGCKEVSF